MWMMAAVFCLKNPVGLIIRSTSRRRAAAKACAVDTARNNVGVTR